MYAMGSMITNVHKSRCRQYSKASLDGYATQNGLWWLSMQLQGMTKMSSRLPSLAMMSGGVLDVDTKMMETRP